MDQTSPGWVKLLVDGSFCLNNQTAGAGIVLRDENDMPILWASHYLEDCLSPLEAELRACMLGLELSRVSTTHTYANYH
jgi:ribonuclease HI